MKKKFFLIIMILLCIILNLGNVLGYAVGQDSLEFILEDAVGAIDDNAKTDAAVTQRSHEHYVRDSELFEYSPEWEAGSRKTLFQYESESRPTYTDSSGATVPVTEFTIVFSKTENITSDVWAERHKEKYGYEEGSYSASVVDDYIAQNRDTVKAAAYADTGTQVKVPCKILADGTVVAYVPEDFPKSGLYAMTNLVAIDADGNTIEYKVTTFEIQYVNMGDGDEDAPLEPDDKTTPPDDPDPTDEDDGKAYASVSKSTTNYTHMQPIPSAGISNSKYDVSTAIPTSENLSFSVTTDDALYDISVRTWVATAGVRDVTLKASVSWSYDYYCGSKSCNNCYKTVTNTTTNASGDKKTTSSRVKRSSPGHTNSGTEKAEDTLNYSISKTYYDVPKSNTYKVQSASITGAPVDGGVSISGFASSPIVGPQTMSVTAKKPTIGQTSASASGYSSASSAKNAAQSLVASMKNTIIASVNSSINPPTRSINYSYRGLSVTTTSRSGQPSWGSTSSGTTKLIPSTKANGNYVTGGSVSYVGAGNLSFGANPNDVFVHTPVVNEITKDNIVSTPFINQRIGQSTAIKYLMLDETFTVTIPDGGTHRASKGYNYKTSYNSYQAVPGQITNWGKLKDVKLPFDAYLHVGNERILIQAGTWLSEVGRASASNTYTFTIPVWAEEAQGAIETRVVAENANDYINGASYTGGAIQEGANLDYTKYVASKNVQIEVIGKIYDLRISATNDPAWENIKGEKGDYITAAEFPFGTEGQNKNKVYRFAPKLGYIIEFDFKTKGIKTDNVDVSVQPEGFYYVSKSGGVAVPVDLYYHTASTKFVKVALENTSIPIVTNLSSPFMKVSKQELVDSLRIMVQKLKAPFDYTASINIGSFPKLKIPANLRLCYNNFAEYINNGIYKKSESAIINDALNGFDYSADRYKGLTETANARDVVLASVGHWYAGYRLPASTIAVATGTPVSDIMNNPRIAKTGGYILVKFDIIGKDGNAEYLEYTGPESISGGNNTGDFDKDDNGQKLNWEEGDKTPPKTQKVTLPNGKEAEVPVGIVAIFETDLRSTNDYETAGTH